MFDRDVHAFAFSDFSVWPRKPAAAAPQPVIRSLCQRGSWADIRGRVSSSGGVAGTVDRIAYVAISSGVLRGRSGRPERHLWARTGTGILGDVDCLVGDKQTANSRAKIGRWIIEGNNVLNRQAMVGSSRSHTQ